MKQSVEFEELQPGDIVTIKSTLSHNGVVTEFTITGEVYSRNSLWVGETPIYRDEFVEAYRVKELPTEPGTLIEITEINGDFNYQKAVLDQDGTWWYVLDCKNNPEEFTEWEVV